LSKEIDDRAEILFSVERFALRRQIYLFSIDADRLCEETDSDDEFEGEFSD
jgi:hypothetical protein